jgi:uncharacterized protein YjbI with pentapeptide repeats
MAEPEHVEILRRGVAAWNEWRDDESDVRPDLSGAHIRILELSGVDLSGADMHGAVLAGVDLSDADLRGADLSGADLMEADLAGADLGGTDLTGANLLGADLSRADLAGAILDGAILYRADLEGTEGAGHHVWLKLLVDFAEGLGSIGSGTEPFEFDDAPDSVVESSYMSTRMSRLEIELADPVSAAAVYEILGAMNRLYEAAAGQDPPGPLIRLGRPHGGVQE